MSRKSVLIEISPHRFEAVYMRGAEAVASSESGLYESGEATLESLLEGSKPTLKEFVGEHRLSGVEAVVLYTSETAAFGVFSCPASAGSKGALAAATLALEESAEYSLALNPHYTDLLRSHAVGEGASKSQPGKLHVFGLAESDGVCAQVTAWLCECDLRVGSLAPTKAVSMLAALDTALAKGSEKTRVVLHMSDEDVVLAAAQGGSLKFVRTIGTGVSSFVDAMTGDMRAKGAGGGRVCLTRSHAASLLFGAGIPESGGVVDAELGITADAVLPLLQPILQRCVVETKQSIKFGLSAEEREGAELVLTGVGGRISGLAGLIARQAGLEYDESDAGSGGKRGGLGAYVGLSERPRGVVPIATQMRRTNRRLHAALAAGIVVAIGLIGYDAYRTHVEMGHVREIAESLKSQSEIARDAVHLSDRLDRSEAMLMRADRKLGELAAGQSRWDAVMGLFSHAVTEQVKISRLQMSRDEGRAVCSVIGEVRADSEAAASREFTSLVEVLSDAPIVERCAIESATRDRTEPGVQRFELRLSLRAAPSPWRAFVAADQDERGGEQ